MRRGLLVIVAAEVVGVPSAALAGENGQGNQGGNDSGAALSVARLQCRNDRATMGIAAFRARYGPRHAFAHCVRAHLPGDRTAAQQCRAERRQLGAPAFRAKYGTPNALRRCIIAKTGTT